MQKSVAFLCALASVSVYAADSPLFNLAYVEVNDNKLANAGCYIRSDNGHPLFDMVSIFAANINGTEPDQPVIYFNPRVDELLNNTNQVSILQNKGIKVLLTLLGNHQNAGWACMTDERAIQAFANNVVETVVKYKLDGIEHTLMNIQPAKPITLLLSELRRL